MTREREPVEQERTELDHAVEERLREIDGDFARQLDDVRIDSGVPEHQRARDLDFIKMTGLTRPPRPAPEPQSTQPSEDGDVDTTQPVSFFEPGVADVDASMAPPSLDDIGDFDFSVPRRPSLSRGAGQERAEESDEGPTVIDGSTVMDFGALLSDEDEEQPLASAPPLSTDAPPPDSADLMVEPVPDEWASPIEVQAEVAYEEAATEEPAAVEDAVPFDDDEGLEDRAPAAEPSVGGLPLDDGGDEVPEELVPIGGASIAWDVEVLEVLAPDRAPGGPASEAPEEVAEIELTPLFEEEEGPIPNDEAPTDTGSEPAREEDTPEDEEAVMEAASAELDGLDVFEGEAEPEPDVVSLFEDMPPELEPEEGQPDTFLGAISEGASPMPDESTQPSTRPGQDTLAEAEAALRELDAAGPRPVSMPASESESFVEDRLGDLWSDREIEVVASSAEAPSPASLPDLAEAEQLLQALEAQPRDPDVAVSAPGEPAALSEQGAGAAGAGITGIAGEGEERDQSIYREPMVPQGRRRSKKGRHRLRRRLIRIAVALGFIVVVGVVGTMAYMLVRAQMEPPEATLSKAEQLYAQRHYAEAATGFERFAQQHPADPQRPDALLRAAVALRLMSAATVDEERVNLMRARGLLGQFLQEYPAHRKALRASVLDGEIAFALGEYGQAIDILRNPAIAVNDPDSALPALRTLALSHAQLGDYAAAESAFLQAASMDGNYATDKDYEQLGDLCKMWADRAESPEARQQFEAKAIQFWDQAMQVTTIDPADRANIKSKRTLVAGREDEGPSAVSPAAPSSTEAAPPPPNVQMPSGLFDSGANRAEPAAPAEADTPAALPDPAPDPAAEAAFLESGGTAAQGANGVGPETNAP